MSSKGNPKVRYTTRQIMAGFGVSDMTVYTWRQGTPQREKMPTEQDGRNVYFPHASTVAWAKKHGLTFDADAAAKAVGTAAKTGPKPTTKPSKKAAPAKKAVPAKARKPKVARAALKDKSTAGPVAARV